MSENNTMKNFEDGYSYLDVIETTPNITTEELDKEIEEEKKLSKKMLEW